MAAIDTGAVARFSIFARLATYVAELDAAFARYKVFHQTFDELTPEESLRFLATLPPLKEDAPLIKGIRIKLQRGAFGCNVSLYFVLWRHLIGSCPAPATLIWNP